MRDPITTPDPVVEEREQVAASRPARVRRPDLRPAGAPGPVPGPGYPAPWLRWQDWGNLLLGAWFFVAAWVISDSFGNNHLWNNWVSGVLVFLASLWALTRPRSSWPEWCNLILGAWIFISPWVLGFSNHPNVNWDAWLVGGAIFILALWALSLTGPSAWTWRRRPTL